MIQVLTGSLRAEHPEDCNGFFVMETLRDFHLKVPSVRCMYCNWYGFWESLNKLNNDYDDKYKFFRCVRCDSVTLVRKKTMGGRKYCDRCRGDRRRG